MGSILTSSEFREKMEKREMEKLEKSIRKDSKKLSREEKTTTRQDS